VLDIFLNFKGTPSYTFPKAFLPPVKPKILNVMQKLVGAAKSHAAPFNLLLHNISIN
jgi:hypothetical protein